VLASASSAEVDVYLGNGAGSFTKKATPFAANAMDIAVAT